MGIRWLFVAAILASVGLCGRARSEEVGPLPTGSSLSASWRTGGLPPGEALDVTVVYGAGAPWVEQHAAEEFARYAGQLVGTTPSVVPDSDLGPGTRDPLVLIGSPGTNVLIKALADRDTVSFSGIQEGTDGFIIRSVSVGDNRYLVLGGNVGRGTLYAVYEYLQRFCGIGFFLDGERVPAGGKLVLDGISVVENPFFRYRKHIRFGGGHLMIRKFTSHWWKSEDFKRNIDWWAKRKLDESDIPIEESGAGGYLRDEALRAVFPDLLPADFRPGANTPASVTTPSSNDWPPEYRNQLEKEAFAYLTNLEFFDEPYVPSDTLPQWFQAAHPEVAERWSDNSVRSKYAKAFFQLVWRNFPPHHHIWGAPFWYRADKSGIEGEWVNDMEVLAQEIAKGIELVREVDPKARFRTDYGWYLSWDPEAWSKADVRQFCEAFPPGAVFLDDYTTDISSAPSYQRYDYYYGQPWSFGTFWNAAMDTLHGDFEDILGKAQRVARDPEARNCLGFRLHQECQGTNVIYRQFLTALAWNPLEVSVDGFLRDWVTQRYSPTSRATMLQAWREILLGMKQNTIRDRAGYGGGLLPLYRYSLRPGTYVMLDESAQSIAHFKRGLEIALQVKDQEATNELYGNDLVDIARTYLGKLFDYYYIQLTLDWKQGRTDDFRKNLRRARSCMRWVERILSTDPSFSLEETENYVMSVPGTPPEVAKKVKAGSFNYAGVDSFEQMHYYCIPRIEADVAALQGLPHATEEEITNAWLDGPTHVDARYRFRGSRVDAVASAARAFAYGDPGEIARGYAEVPLRLVALWQPTMESGRVPPPEITGDAAFFDDFSADKLDPRHWSPHDCLAADGVAVIRDEAKARFAGEDWAVEFAVNFQSRSYAAPAVRLRAGKNSAGIYCQNGELRFSGKVRGRNFNEHIAGMDDRYHVFRIEKSGGEARAYVDGQLAQTQHFPAEPTSWTITLEGADGEPLFIDWIVVRQL